MRTAAPNWFDAKKNPAETDRKTVEMNWNPTEEQFNVSAAVTCYKPNSEEVSHAYSTTTAYFLQKYLDEAEKYMIQYVTGEYTLNDGRYLSTITVPVTGWYTDEACTQEAIVKLTWNGQLTNPIDDHQFNLNDPIPIYRQKGGETECKYMTGTFYSDADRKKGDDFLKSIGVAGTYQPTEVEGKWWIEIDDKGKVTIHATDSKNEEHTYEDVAMDLTMDKKTTSP